MARRIWLLGMLSLLLAARDAPPPGQDAPPADFKLVMEFATVGDEETESAELIVHEGRAVQHAGHSMEMVLIDPAHKRVELLDLDRRVQARVSFERLDKHLADLKKALLDKAAALDKEGGKPKQVTATATRRLVEPSLRETVTKDAEGGRVRLTNPVVEVDAAGATESDAKRLDLIGELLLASIKLGSLRHPRNIPPYSRLEATSAVVRRHALRPTEMSFLYRIAGKPVKYRWTYRLEPRITDRDLAAFATLDRFRARATLMTFDEYEK
jgi:hypothetical protein